MKKIIFIMCLVSISALSTQQVDAGQYNEKALKVVHAGEVYVGFGNSTHLSWTQASNVSQIESELKNMDWEPIQGRGSVEIGWLGDVQYIQSGTIDPGERVYFLKDFPSSAGHRVDQDVWYEWASPDYWESIYSEYY